MLELLLFRVVCVILLILANGFFVAAEFAIVSLRETRIAQLRERNPTGAAEVAYLQAHLDDFLPAVQFGVTLASLALGWIGQAALSAVFISWFRGLPHAEIYAHFIAIPLAFACITYFHVLVGELVPKSLALQRADRVALAVARPMQIFIAVTRPAVRLLNTSAAFVLRGFDIRKTRHTTLHSPEELKLIATASRRGGLLPQAQEQIIHRAVELNRVQVREIMTPRQRIFSLPANMLVEEASGRIVEDQHSRVPVYDPERGLEHIIGVVYSKDISRLMHFRLSAQTRFNEMPFSEVRLNQIMRDVLFVPETKHVSELLLEFQQQRRHLAIVVDEFGTTSGLVTVEDALEQVVGEMDDEFDIVTPALGSTQGPIVLDGSVAIRDLETQMGLTLPRKAGIETLAGFMLLALGHIPSPGESIVNGDRRFTIVEMLGHRIGKVRVESATAPQSEPLL
jgi:putative hemolysin